jgi:hypothetical protein
VENEEMLIVCLRHLDKNSESDVKDFVLEFFKFVLYFVNDGNDQKVLVRGMKWSELGNRDT